jgi:hypothetical protein
MNIHVLLARWPSLGAVPAMVAMAFAALMNAACNRDDEHERERATKQQLIGTWRETEGDLREYALAADGTFSMRFSWGKCQDAAAYETMTVSGSWAYDGRRLVMEVAVASTPVLRGGTMYDTIVELDASKLVLETSVVGCSGKIIRLRRQ